MDSKIVQEKLHLSHIIKEQNARNNRLKLERKLSNSKLKKKIEYFPIFISIVVLTIVWLTVSGLVFLAYKMAEARNKDEYEKTRLEYAIRDVRYLM